ncbi:hypothetical protein ACS0TY_000590 [Phlomoides rotata]
MATVETRSSMNRSENTASKYSRSDFRRARTRLFDQESSIFRDESSQPFLKVALDCVTPFALVNESARCTYRRKI